MGALSGTKDETTTASAGEGITRRQTRPDRSALVGAARSVLSHHSLTCASCSAALDAPDDGEASRAKMCDAGRAALDATRRIRGTDGALYPPEAIARFWGHVDRSGGPLACWPWKLALDKDGYGDFWLSKGVKLRAHRVALELHIGRRLEGYEVARHGDTCASGSCCNGAHLSPGRPVDNVADRDRLGRTARGERNGKAKLTAAAVLTIRARAGERPEDIAAELGVGHRCVRRALKGETWAHVSDDRSAQAVAQ